MFDEPVLALRYLSYIVTAVVGLASVRRRTLRDAYAEGLWEGNLFDSDDRHFYIKCELLLVRSHGNPFRGYCRYHTFRGGRPLASGIDQLTKCEGRKVPPRQITAKFAREFFYDYETSVSDRSEVTYDYAFEVPVTALIMARSMTVTTSLTSGRVVHGTLYRSSL